MDALEERTGVSKRTISEIERGMREPQPLTLAKLANALGVDLDDLLEEEAPKVSALSPEEVDGGRRPPPEIYPELEGRFTKLAADFRVILDACRRLMGRSDFDADLAWATKATSEHYYNFADRYFNVVEDLNAVQGAAGAGEDVPDSLLRAAADLRAVLFGRRGVQGVGAAALDRARADSPIARLSLLDNPTESEARERSA
jgi:transcriptional regulator with XRE-family HTH domain